MEPVRPIRRRGRPATVLVAVVGLAVVLFARSASAQEAGIDILPLAPGNTWTYEGTVWWVPRNSLRVLEERVELDMRVVEVVERPGARAALLVGYPRDLVTPMANRFDGEFALLQVGSTVYLLRGEQARAALRRVADPVDSLADLLLGSEVVLDLPLVQGKSFCPPGGGTRPAGAPCWLVSGEKLVDRTPLVGLDETRGRHRFVLALKSRSADEVRGFLPGVGFTSFAIGHFGDPSALELELVDARIATSPRPARGLFLKTLDLSDEVIEMATASDLAERRAYERSLEPGPPRTAGPAAAREASNSPPVWPSPARGGSSEPLRDNAVGPDPPAVREPGVRPGSETQGEAPREATAPTEEPAPVAPPVPEPFPSPDRLLPDRRPFRRLDPVRPVRVEVAVESLPVPVWEETRPACLDARDWYLGEGAIEVDGRVFEAVGSAEPIDPENLVPVGEYDGVPTFAGRLSATPHTDLWLPLCIEPGTYRLYADLNRGGG